jgi:Uma2 family endonuclease
VRISVAEYLREVYEPDAEYVDGEVVERNGGLFNHSRIQTLIACKLGEFEETHRLYVLLVQRVRVAEERYRVPDVVVLVRPFRIAPVLIEPPAMVIEILSPDDHMSMMLVKVADYKKFGIQCIFVVDPAQQVLFKAEAGGLIPVPDCTLRLATSTGEIAVALEPLFADIAS